MSTQKNEERKRFKIELEEHAPFNGIAETSYITSNEILKLVSEVFRGVFADFEGCMFEPTNDGEPTIALLFNHGKYNVDGEKISVACEKAGGKESGYTVIDRSRYRDRQMLEGDRYYLTEDGKDAFAPLLVTKRYNNGNPNWKYIVSEFTERTPYNMYNQSQPVQYTKVSGISLDRMCGLLFGTKMEDDYYEYKAQIVGTLTPPANIYMAPVTCNYMLTVTRVSSKQVSEAYRKAGFGNVNAYIVR